MPAGRSTFVHRSTCVAALCAVVAGCASRSTEVRALPDVDPKEYASWDCTRLQNELDRVQRRAVDVAWEVDQRAGNNIVALGVGVMVFWPALLAMQRDGPPAVELAQLRGRDDALRAASRAQHCPPPAADMAPTAAASLPIAVGDRLVYVDRPQPRHPGREVVLLVQSLRRDEIEFMLMPPPGTDPSHAAYWRQDLAGNVSGDIPPGVLHWRRLLKPDLALGQVVAGEMRIGDQPDVRARVRGQVVAVGPQTLAGRHFDVAVIELFGDVVRLDAATRLDGVMAVDRKSGVLLRLELRSADAWFATRRELSRIESPQ